VSQIVFLTLYLGLASGHQPLALQAEPNVKSIRIVLDGKSLATLTGPPWRAEIDFGPALLPHEVVALGLDASGKEIGRATQFVNVPRPFAEIEIALTRNAEARPTRAKLVVRHIARYKPRTAALKLDDAPLALDNDFAAALPPVDLRKPHLLSAEMHFADGAVARRELVFGGQFADSAEAQLTPVAVVQTRPEPAGDCFAPLHVRSVEESEAEVIVVRDPDTSAIRKLYPNAGAEYLDRGTLAQVIIPVPNEIRGGGEQTQLFPNAGIYEVWKMDLLQLLLRAQFSDADSQPRQYADAVAVAGVHAAAGGRRRAVVLLLSARDDASDYAPAVVRNYLAALGVPLLVWAPAGVSAADARASWGEVEDVSSRKKLGAAIEHLRQVLRRQRVAWIEADPVAALRAEPKPECGYARAAR
jgi:hypothetical protein